jgi:hypothetical protein
MGKWEANLPAVLVPDGEICVNVMIPNHPDYVKLFLRAVRMLEVNRMYQRDEGLSAKIVTEQWRDRTINPLIEALANGTGCPDERSECLDFPAYAGFIKYLPDNPYVDEEPIPSGYLTPAWWRWGKFETELPDWIDDWVGALIEQFTGYRANDAVCWISSLLSLNIPAWLDTGYSYPAIEIELSGKGTIELVMVSMPLGSRVLIEVDEKPNIVDILTGGIFDENLDVVDTHRDFSSFPPEEYPEIRYRVEIPEDGEHTVYVMFLPVVNFSISDDALGFGGGLRGVELCGGLRPRDMPPPPPPPPLEGVTELRPEMQFTAECGLEYRLRDQNDEIVQDWTPVAGWVEYAYLCFGAGMATKEDIKQALIEWSEDTASRYLGVLLDEDGNPTIPPTEGESGGVIDNPATPQNEASEARAGGVKAITAGYNSIWADMNAWKTASLTADVVSFRLQQKYSMESDAATDTFVAAYFGIYATGHINSYTESLSEMMFCGGENIKNIVADYIISSIAFDLQENAFLLNAALSDEQITAWFNEGAQIPSTAYIEYSCVPIAVEEFPLDMSTANTPAYNTSGVWKPGHRMLVEIEGTFVDTDVPNVIGDGMYFLNTLTNVKTFAPLGMNSTGVTVPTAAQVPFAEDHKYRFTVDKTAISSPAIVNVSKDNGTMATPNVTGIISVKFTDLGEFA